MAGESKNTVPSILSIRKLEKSFGSLSVLKDISLSVDRGNVISIIGPSGSGKSTLLRCASFLETADGGDILYDGQYAMRDGVYASKAELNRFRTRFGLVFQNFQLFPHYSVLKNITEAPILHGEDKEEVHERALRKTPIPISSPAGSSSGWPSPVLWPCGPRCCTLTNPPPPWIRSSPVRC